MLRTILSVWAVVLIALWVMPVMAEGESDVRFVKECNMPAVNILFDDDDDDDGKEEKIRLKDCPKPVQETIRKQAKGGKILEIEKETARDGTVTYEAEIRKDKKIYECEVAADGKLISMKLEDDDDDDDDEDD